MLGIAYCVKTLRPCGCQFSSLFWSVVAQEACDALAEVLPRDVATPLARLWQAAMTGGQLSAFCEILEAQVNYQPASHTVTESSAAPHVSVWTGRWM